MNDIFDLQETSPDHWRAKYKGNYGVYTIKISPDGKKTTNFSCSCPSSYYPCKHIPIIEEAISKRIARNHENTKTAEITVEKLLKDVSCKELYDFIVRQAKYNPQLTETILLEFTHKISNENTNTYSGLLRTALNDVGFDYEDYYQYEEDYLEIDVLDQLLDKARKYIEQQNYREAILICKACIEEFAAWFEEVDSDFIDYVSEEYQYESFNILKSALSAPDMDSKELFEYCKSELSRGKYSETAMYDCFHDLLMELAATTNTDEFIAMQDKLLDGASDKSSLEAKKIFQRKIDFYKKNEYPEKAWEIIEANIQIESFREEAVKKRMRKINYRKPKNW
jgi:hypothetical protein